MSEEFKLTPEQIERFRQTGIRLDREGRFWHEGAEVSHVGLRRALLRWLDRLPDGRPILRLDEERYAYVDVEDADLLAVSARWAGERPILVLNDESEEELDPSTLELGEGGALYCRVRGGVLTARIITPAYYVLAERIDETAPGVFALRAGGQLHAIRRRAARSG
jgi:uncharacterized protein